jgi:hypothetical protein
LARSNSETSTLVHARPGTQHKNREDFLQDRKRPCEQLPFRMHVTHSFKCSVLEIAREIDKPQRKREVPTPKFCIGTAARERSLIPAPAVSSGGTTPNLRETDGRLKLSVGLAGVAVRRDARRMVSTPIPYASPTLCATLVSSNSRPAE